MPKKVLAWIKKYGHYLVLPFALLAGFLAGRYSSRGARADFDKLRANYEELADRLRKREEELARLADLHDSDAEQYRALAEELSRARAALAEIGDSIDSGQGNVDELGSNNKRLADWILRYGPKLEDIPDQD